MRIVVGSEKETINIGYQLGCNLNIGDVVLLAGDLGAGKTTLTKGIGEALGVKKTINSPTFTIMKMYHANIPLYHFDLYRLNGEGNDFDLEDYIYGEGISVIEWPNQAKELLPNEYLLIEINRIDDNTREILLIPKGERYDKLVEVIK